MSDLLVILGIGAAVLIAFIGGVAVIARSVSHHYAAQACTSFGQQSLREVRFVDYTFWSWDCLTPAADGKWISTANLREFVEQP